MLLGAFTVMTPIFTDGSFGYYVDTFPIQSIYFRESVIFIRQRGRQGRRFFYQTADTTAMMREGDCIIALRTVGGKGQWTDWREASL